MLTFLDQASGTEIVCRSCNHRRFVSVSILYSLGRVAHELLTFVDPGGTNLVAIYAYTPKTYYPHIARLAIGFAWGSITYEAARVL